MPSGRSVDGDASSAFGGLLSGDRGVRRVLVVQNPPVPYDLRHSFAWLMFHEQRNPLEIAEMMGHSPQVLFSTYAHVIAELRGAASVSAEEQIQTARSRIRDEDA